MCYDCFVAIIYGGYDQDHNKYTLRVARKELIELSWAIEHGKTVTPVVDEADKKLVGSVHLGGQARPRASTYRVATSLGLFEAAPSLCRKVAGFSAHLSDYGTLHQMQSSGKPSPRFVPLCQDSPAQLHSTEKRSPSHIFRDSCDPCPC